MQKYYHGRHFKHKPAYLLKRKTKRKKWYYYWKWKKGR